MSNYIEENSELIMLRSMVNVFMPEALDPVGQEDDDVDNDGDSDKSDAYLKKRRKAVGAAIAADRAKKKIKEDLEQELQEKVLYKSEKPVASGEKQVEIIEKPVVNKITVNPEMKESVSSRIQSIYEKKYVGEGLKQARANVGADKCWDGYTAKGTKKKGGKEVPNCVKEEEIVEGIRDKDPEKGTEERKERLEKKRGMKLDDHPQYKKKVDEGVVDTVKNFIGLAKNKDHKVSDKTTMGKAVTGLQKRRQATDDAMKMLRQSYYPEGDIIEARKPEVEEKGKKVAEYERAGKYQGITSKFRKENPGSRQAKKERGRKQTEGELSQERVKKHNERVRKHGFTSKEKKESEARSKYDSARD